MPTKQSLRPCHLSFNKLFYDGRQNVPRDVCIYHREALKWENSYTIKCLPNILGNPSAVSEVMSADYVVLVEKQEESCYTQITRELEALFAWNKKVLGFIVIGVDAVA